MRATLLIGALVLIAAVILTLAPSITIQQVGHAELVAVNGQGTKGTATLTPLQGGQYIMVDVQVQQLEPHSVYGLSLRQGSCYGPLVAALKPATTDASGNGTSSSTIPAQITASLFVVLHRGHDITSGVLACGEVVLSSTLGGNGAPVTFPGPPPIISSPITTPGEPEPTSTPGTPSQFPNTGGGPPR